MTTDKGNRSKVQRSLREFIKSDAYTNTTIHYDANAVKIGLHENHSETRYILLYIYPPWRITRQGRIVNSSELYSEDTEASFVRYTQSTLELSKQRIVGIGIKPESYDLSLKWEDGASLESFNLEGEEHCYHIYDHINSASCDVAYGVLAMVGTDRIVGRT